MSAPSQAAVAKIERKAQFAMEKPIFFYDADTEKCTRSVSITGMQTLEKNFVMFFFISLPHADQQKTSHQ